MIKLLPLLLCVSAITAFPAEKPKTIPAGAKIFVTAEQGFDTFLTAALEKKKVPVTVVTDKSKADYELQAATNSEKAGWASTIFLKQTGSNEEASVRLVDLKSGEVVFAYAVNKRNSVHGKQSSAESCAKHMKDVVRD